VRDAFADGAPTERSFEEYYPPIERWLAVDIHVEESVIVYVRDRTDQRETERTVDHLEQRLERIQQIDSLIVTVLGRLISASDRVEVAETVCNRLGGTDPYTFAWVGDRDFPADSLRVLAAAGTAPDLREEIDAHLNGESALPGQEAVATGETQLVQQRPGGETGPRGIRRAAFGHGLQSALAVPLEYQGTVHGVVSVYSRQEAGFSEQERVGLETLGSVAGFAVQAIRQEGLLVTDTVTEVTLEARGERIPFVEVARTQDVEMSLDSVVPRGDGAVVCYLRGVERNDVLDRELSTRDAVTDVRWIRDETDPLVQVTLTGETPLTTLVAWGATVGSAEYTGDAAYITARAPPDEDVRRLVEAVDATVDETSLLAKEETTRTNEQVESFRDSLAERLTEKQRTVLRTAYLSDYFESPRGSTSAEVAETLDITGPTMLYHLRRAQRKLVAAFLATERETGSTDDA
jgi:predicted DNA binding protein